MATNPGRAGQPCEDAIKCVQHFLCWEEMLAACVVKLSDGTHALNVVTVISNTLETPEIDCTKEAVDYDAVLQNCFILDVNGNMAFRLNVSACGQAAG